VKAAGVAVERGLWAQEWCRAAHSARRLPHRSGGETAVLLVLKREGEKKSMACCHRMRTFLIRVILVHILVLIIEIWESIQCLEY